MKNWVLSTIEEFSKYIRRFWGSTGEVPGGFRRPRVGPREPQGGLRRPQGSPYAASRRNQEPPGGPRGSQESSWSLPGPSGSLLGPPGSLLVPPLGFFGQPKKLPNVLGNLPSCAQNPIFYGIPWPPSGNLLAASRPLRGPRRAPSLATPLSTLSLLVPIEALSKPY